MGMDSEKMLFDMMADIRDDIKKLSDRLADSRESVAGLKVQSGFLAAFVSTVISAIVGYFVSGRK